MVSPGNGRSQADPSRVGRCRHPTKVTRQITRLTFLSVPMGIPLRAARADGLRQSFLLFGSRGFHASGKRGDLGRIEITLARSGGMASWARAGWQGGRRVVKDANWN